MNQILRTPWKLVLAYYFYRPEMIRTLADILSQGKDSSGLPNHGGEFQIVYLLHEAVVVKLE